MISIAEGELVPRPVSTSIGPGAETEAAATGGGGGGGGVGRLSFRGSRLGGVDEASAAVAAAAASPSAPVSASPSPRMGRRGSISAGLSVNPQAPPTTT